MDQRVPHAAVTENKRLSAVLAHVKGMQEKAPSKPTGESHIGFELI